MALSFQNKIKPISEIEKESATGVTSDLSFANKIQTIPEQPGFVQSIAQSLISPFLRFGSNILGIAQGVGGLTKAGFQAITGDTEAAERTIEETAEIIQPGKEFDFGYLGKVKTIETPKEALGVGAEIAGTILPIGKIPALAKTTLGAKVLKGTTEGIKVGAIGGGLTSAGQALQQDKDVGETFFDAATGVILGGTLGGVIGGGAPVAGKIYQKFAKPYEERIMDIVKDNFFKAIKPSTVGKISSKATEQYLDKAAKGITLITNNKDKLTLAADKTGVLPETVEEFSTAITQAKSEMFRAYNTLAKTTGKTGQKINLLPIADELDAVANDIGIQDNFPQIAIYAEQKAQRLRARQFYDPETTEKIITEYNAALKNYYANPTYEAVTKVRIDALAVNRMRKALDDLIETATGQEYQELKYYYGALKAIEKDVNRAAIRIANRNAKGFIDFTDIFSAGDIIGGIATLDPSFFVKGVAQKLISSWFKQLNSPDNLIKKMFLDVEQNLNKIKTSKVPPLLKATEAVKEYVKNPKIGLSIEDVSKKVPKITQQGSLTTKFLSYIDEKLAKNPNATLSKQEILDFAKRPELKKGEADLLLKKLEEFEPTQSLPKFKSANKDFEKYVNDVYDEFSKKKAKILSGAKATDPNIIDVRLGGSYGKGKPTTESDIDLEFIYNGKPPENLYEKLAGQFEIGGGMADAGVVPGTSKLPAQDFADSIRRDLLELKPVKVKEPHHFQTTIDKEMTYARKNNANYEEVVFESPIVTNGSPTHYPNSKNYFAHARGDEVVEGGKKIWREQEIQSDILRSDRLTNEFEGIGKEYKGQLKADLEADKLARQKELEKLSPFTNDRFGERIMRERIREKAQKGYSKYRLPTGETIGKIEGFRADEWYPTEFDPRLPASNQSLKIEDLKLGMQVRKLGDFRDDWIITDILGDGRFKAVPKDRVMTTPLTRGDWRKIGNKQFIENTEVETFDLTGKSNPQYRRYENWGKFLKNKFGGKEVVDPQGNSWVEIDIKPEYKKLPVEAFGFIALPTPQKKDEK